MTERQRTTLFDEPTIQAKVAELADHISRDYADADELLLVGVLKGAFIFLADLARRLTIPRRVDFIAVSSYDEGTTAGPVRLMLDLREGIEGRHVLVVEDIIDTGATLRYLTDMLRARKPASLRTCVLVRKTKHSNQDFAVDYLGWEIPDLWVIGYGLDHADRNRTLPYIAALEE
jgi:hypoxanthine phosphoribosyltransferase